MTPGIDEAIQLLRDAGYRVLPRRVPNPRRQQNGDRDAEIVAAYLNDPESTLESVGTVFGISRERIRQILVAADVDLADVRRQRREAREEQNSIRLELARQQQIAANPPCPVCGGPNPRTWKTCSPLCAEAWPSLRLHLDETVKAAQRYAQAKSDLAHPERCKPSCLILARSIVDGTAPPPNRTWVSPNGKAAFYIRKLGLDIPIGKSDSTTTACPAMNLDGTPCRRRTPDGELCHIHMKDRRFLEAS